MGTLLAHQRLVALTCSVILPRPIVTHMGIQQVHLPLAVQICSVTQQRSKGAVLEAVSGHGNIIMR